MNGCGIQACVIVWNKLNVKAMESEDKRTAVNDDALGRSLRQQQYLWLSGPASNFRVVDADNNL